MRLRLVTKSMGSASLKRLQAALNEQVSYKVWRSRKPKLLRKNVLYGDGKGKIEQYAFFREKGISALEFTTSYQEALAWVQAGLCVVARTLTRSSEGKGIVIAETPEQLPKAPVYTVYKKKKKEFRVHVYNDQVVCVLEKRRKKATFTGDHKVRNTVNGYTFCRADVVEPDGIRELALAASKVTNSAFKGVDIGYNEKLNQLFVIEVNSAPGFSGTTVQEYANAVLN